MSYYSIISIQGTEEAPPPPSELVPAPEGASYYSVISVQGTEEAPAPPPPPPEEVELKPQPYPKLLWLLPLGLLFIILIGRRKEEKE